MSDTTPTPDDTEAWATISFALARDVNRLKVICTQDHPAKMGSPTKGWSAGTETRHSDGARCVLLEGGEYAVLPGIVAEAVTAARAECDALRSRVEALAERAVRKGYDLDPGDVLDALTGDQS